MQGPDLRLIGAALKEIWGPVGEDVRRGFRWQDVWLVLAAPVVLVLVYLLPAAVQNALLLDASAPAVHTFVTTHLVHGSVGELVRNVGGYLLAVMVLYPLVIVARERTWFRRSFLAAVLAIPPVVAVVAVLAGGGTAVRGFMTVNAALVGMIPVAVFRMMDEKSRNSIGIANALSLVLFSLAMTTVRHARSYRDLAILLAALAGAVYFSWRALRSIEDTARLGARALAQWHGYVDLLIVATVLYLGTAWLILFPAEPPQPVGPIDISGHYLAFVLGFLVPAALMVGWEHLADPGYIIGELREKVPGGSAPR